MWIARVLRSMLGRPPAAPQTSPPQTSPPQPSPTPPRATASPQSDTRDQSKPLAPVDAGPLAPLSPDEALQAARRGELGRLRWWADRRGLPTGPQAELIERAMVGRGLVSAEELRRLRETYDAYPELQPLDWRRQAAGQQAVAASREERAAIKRQKQEEAAARRAAHDAAVAERRATDIVFLGRGVSRGLSERDSDAAKLAAAGLPMLSTPADVAALLQVDIPALRWLAFDHPAATLTHYARFEVPKKSGGMRQLASPKPMLRATLAILNEQIVAPLAAGSGDGPAHGFVRGRSIVTNAAPHVGAAIVVNLDLADFFPSITQPRVKGLLQSVGYSPAAATVLSLLMTDSPRRLIRYDGRPLHVATGPRSLPQGACTSPGLSNAIARSLDRRLAGYAAAAGWTYTRYADDLTFSAPTADAQVGRLLARVRHIAEQEGFAVNRAKTRVQRPRQRQSVTGVVVNAKPSTPRQLRRQLRAILHNARTTGLEAQNTDGHPNFAAWVEGQIAFVAMVNAEQGAALRTAYESLRTGEASEAAP